MKKSILTMGTAVILTAALSIGGTLAYLKSADKDINTMATGQVKIVQNEQQRGADGKTLEAFEQNQKMLPGVYESKTNNNSWNNPMGYEGEIVVGGETYTNVFDNVGNAIDKIITVSNIGSEAAYVRTLVAFEDTDDISGYLHYCAPVLFTFPSNNGDYLQFEKDGAKYTVGYVVYKEALAAGETSAPSLLQLFWDKCVTNEIMAKAGRTYDVIALSQATQATGFTSAEAALNDAFGAITYDEDAMVAEWFNGTPVKTSGENNNVITNAAALEEALANGGDVVINGTIVPTDLVTDLINDSLYLAMYNGGTLTGGKISIDDTDTKAWTGLFLNSEKADGWGGNGEAVTVNNVEVSGNLRTAIAAQAISNPITLNNVTVKNEYGVGVYAEWGGNTVTLNDCYIEGANGSDYVEWAKTAVSVAAGADVVINGGGYTGKYAVYVCSTGGTVTINGGTFVGGLVTDAGSIVINGGTFSVDPTAFVADGHTVTDNGNGTWTVA